MGADMAVNAGGVAAALFCEEIPKWGIAIKVAATAAGKAVVAAVTAPVVVVPVATVVSGYAGWKVYRYFWPTKKTEAEEIESVERIELAQCRRDKMQTEKDFKDCLSRYHPPRRVTIHGYPEECQQEAHKLAMHKGGDSEVLELTRKHVMFAPIPYNKQGDK
jgi:hypothetical protein